MVIATYIVQTFTYLWKKRNKERVRTYTYKFTVFMLVSWQLGDYSPSLHFVLFVHILNTIFFKLLERTWQCLSADVLLCGLGHLGWPHKPLLSGGQVPGWQARGLDQLTLLEPALSRGYFKKVTEPKLFGREVSMGERKDLVPRTVGSFPPLPSGKAYCSYQHLSPSRPHAGLPLQSLGASVPSVSPS